MESFFGIPRHLNEEFLQNLQEFPVVAILGPRQCGKTTLARQMEHQLGKENSIYLDLELPSDLARLDEAELFLKGLSDKTVILDEVQRKPELFPLLRSLVDQDRRPGRFILLGSASPELVWNKSESLAGRVGIIELSPFLCNELPSEIPALKHWLRGGFPGSLFAKTEEASQRWLRNFTRTYLERDLPLLGLRSETLKVQQFWKMLAHSNGGIWNGQTFSRAIGVSSPTITKYLDFLNHSYMATVLQPWHTNGRKRLVKSPKVYFSDTGILHYLNGIRKWEDLFGNPILGTSWESYVIAQVRGNLPPGCGIAFYRTHEGAECDLMVLKDEKPWLALELKATASPSIRKGFIQSIEDLGTDQNFVVIPTESSFPMKHGVTAVGVSHLIQKMKSIRE